MPPRQRWLLAAGLLTCCAALQPSARFSLSDCGGSVHVLRATAWPGGGVQVVLGVGWSGAGDSSKPPSLPRVEVNNQLASVVPAPQKSGMTGFLLVPTGNVTALCLALQAAVEKLPRRETVVVWMLSPGRGRENAMELVVDVTNSKSHVIARLAQLRGTAGAERSTFYAQQVQTHRLALTRTTTDGLEAALRALDRVDRHGDQAVSRNLVIVAERAVAVGSAPTGLVDASPVAVSSILWLTALDAKTFDSRTSAVGWSNDTREASVLKAGEALAAVIAARRTTVFRAGVCLPNAPDARLQLKVSSEQPQAAATCRVLAPDFAAEAEEMSDCDADDIAADSYPFSDNITMSLTAEQEAVFEHNRAFFNGTYEEGLDSKGLMNLSVAFGSGSAIRATAHFRGSSSFRECVRKSMTVRLSGARARRLQPGSTSDRFLLISICEDDRYVKTMLVNTLSRHVGVYRFPQRYVTVTVAHSNRSVEPLGLYLLIEDADVTFEKGAVQLAAVVRRRVDPLRQSEPLKGTPSVKVFDSGMSEPPAAVLAKYDSLEATGAACDPAGSACYDQLSAVMDLDMFLRWAALNSFVGNGDWLDEVFFFSSRELRSSFYWSINSWDSDDSFEYDPKAPGYGCHHDGADAQWDPHGMLYCSEGSLDKVLTRSPDVYARWADHLEYLLHGGGLSPSLVADVALRQLADVYGLLDDATAVGLVELRAVDPNATTALHARADIGEALTFYTGWLEKRRAALLRQMRIYRARMQRPAAPVPFVDASGNYVPGAVLTPAPPMPPPPQAPPPRALNEAPPGQPLLSACTALASGHLRVSLGLRTENYTAALPQELLLVPHVQMQAGDAGASLAGLRLGATFDRVTLEVDLEGDPLPIAQPAADFETACYSGGAVPAQRGANASNDACVQYGARVAVLDGRVELTLSAGTLCAGCALDLGVDGALASVWHARWLPLVNVSRPLIVTARCGGEEAVAPSVAPAPDKGAI